MKKLPSAGAQHHAALVLPQAWVVLETSLCWLARGMSAVSNGAASRLRSGVSTMASSHLRYWTMAALEIGVLRRRSRRPSGPPLTAGLHNKERTPLRALVSRTRRYFTADVSVFQAHLPCDSLSILSYRIEPKSSVM